MRQLMYSLEGYTAPPPVLEAVRHVTMEAVARVLFGEIEARGVLPGAIPAGNVPGHI